MFFWKRDLSVISIDLCCDREQRMKLLDYMLNLWSHFKGISHQGQRLLFEGGQSILMRNWRQSLKVSIVKELCIFLAFNYYLFPKYSYVLFLFLFHTMDIWIIFSLWGSVNKNMDLFIHSRMAGEKSKDGVSVPKKGSR